MSSVYMANMSVSTGAYLEGTEGLGECTEGFKVDEEHTIKYLEH